MKSFFSSLLGATLFVILLFFPGLVFEGAKMGLNLWFFTLVPTLLPFMVFSNILIQSRLIEHLLFLPGLFTRKYLHLSPAGLYAFLCGFFFGYPSGAKILADLLKTDQIDPKEASMLFGFCNNVSPAFLITYFLTLHLKHPEKAGITVSFLYIIPAFVCLMAFFFCGSSFSLREKKTSSPVLSLALLDACLQDALSVLLKLGGYIIFFFRLIQCDHTHTPHACRKCRFFLLLSGNYRRNPCRHCRICLSAKLCDIAPVSGFWRSLLFHANRECHKRHPLISS